MIQVTDKIFEQLVDESLSELPKRYTQHLKNVVFLVEDDPSPEQRARLHLLDGQTLYGLYEGVPLPARGTGYNMVLPDRITIFKQPMEFGASTMAELKAQVKRTLWHEVAHYYGLGHDRIHELEKKF